MFAVGSILAESRKEYKYSSSIGDIADIDGVDYLKSCNGLLLIKSP
jgi:hypothetical protein